MSHDISAAGAQTALSPDDFNVETKRTPRVNINTASAEELERLPGVGPVLAARIVEHRRCYGKFRRVEHLIIVRGMSNRRFREMRDFLTIE